MTQRPLSALPTIYSEQLNYTLPFVQHPFNHHVYIYLHTRWGKYMSIFNLYIYTHTHTHAYTYIHIYTHTCTYIYTYIHTYIHIHIHIHIHYIC